MKTSLLLKERQQPPAADSEAGQWSQEENLGASIAHTGKQFRVTWSDREAASSKNRSVRAQEPSNTAAAASRADSRISLWSWYLHTGQRYTRTSGCDNHYSEPWNTGNLSQRPEKKFATHILKKNTKLIEIKYIYINSVLISSVSSQKALGKCNPQQVNVLNIWIIIFHLQERWLRKYDCIYQYVKL